MPQPVEQVLEVLARVALQRRQHLVELDRRRVCVTLIVSPSSSSGAPGVPGVRSTKKLPSRKMRGRIFAVASACSGRPVVVDLHRHDGGVGALLAARPP